MIYLRSENKSVRDECFLHTCNNEYVTKIDYSNRVMHLPIFYDVKDEIIYGVCMIVVVYAMISDKQYSNNIDFTAIGWMTFVTSRFEV